MSDAPLHILHVLSHDRLESGGAIQALLLAHEQRRRGHRVAFVLNAGLHGRGPEAAQRLRAAGFECECVPMQGIGRLLGQQILRRLVRARMPDVVHTHRDRAVVFTVAALRRGWRPVLIAQKGNSYRSKPALARALRDPALARVICVADAVRQAVVWDGVPARKTVVVLGCFDADRFATPMDRDAARKALHLPLDVPIVGALANLDRKKGHDVLLRAARAVLERRPDAWFVFAGGGEVAPLERLAAGYGIARRLRFLGFRADPERVLAALDVSVSASTKGEGLSGAIRESLALGVPVACTDVGGNRELVQDGVTGRLVVPGDAGALAQAILAMLDDPAEARRMAQNGRAEVHARMNPRARCAQVEAVYRSALQERAGMALRVQASSVECEDPRPRAPAMPLMGTGLGARGSRRRSASRMPLLSAMVLVLILPLVVNRELRAVDAEVDLMLNHGMAGLDGVEDILQSLLDLRAQVFALAADPDMSTLAGRVEQTQAALLQLRRDAAQLESVDVERLLHADEDQPLQMLLTEADRGVARLLNEAQARAMEGGVLFGEARLVSEQIDEAASAAHALSSLLGARARISDAAIPTHLERASRRGWWLAGIAGVLLAVSLIQRHNKPGS